MIMQVIWEKIKHVLRIISYISKGVSNLPDYQAYVRHVQEKHPGQTPPSEKEFFEELLANKYGPNAKRCC
ncbi:YbdD/YjiX family protein [Bacillus sp. NEB1478]|uniref:YbdD/YjiX family protein n=1 Tax=Bacillus sp. NEB1478 TaxID=3073816 RepID=UPI0028735069|nr:YbdD/YjiX family protein [Bacillus sp. NEB1478]WNB91611.1 YbdD/YjiX family protein [Bacillus sp. NEB1478]